MAIAFYCLGVLDVTSLAERQISPTDRKSWKEWIWDQYVGKELFCTLLHLGVLTLFFCRLCLYVCTRNKIEGGFYPGPLVKVSGGETTAAHVRLIPPPSCAPRFKDHHDNHIYAILFPHELLNSLQMSHLENSTFVRGKVSNSHRKEGQQKQEEQEWWRPPRPRLI